MPKQMSPKLVKDYAGYESVYERFSVSGELHIVCPQCRAVVMLFEQAGQNAKREIAALRRENPVSAMNRLQQVSGCDLRQAKANVLHIRDAESGCHHCGTKVPRGALLCPQCMSVNLDW